MRPLGVVALCLVGIVVAMWALTVYGDPQAPNPTGGSSVVFRFGPP